MRSSLSELIKRDINEIYVVPNAVLDSDYEYKKRDYLRDSKDRLACFNFCCVGRLTNQKGLETLFLALSKLKFNFKLYLMGDGELKNKLIQYSKELNIYDNIFFEGRVENPWSKS